MGQSAQDAAMNHRKQITDASDPLLSVDISVQNREDCLHHTIPKTAVEILDLTPEDTVEIDIYRNRYVAHVVGVTTDTGDGRDPLLSVDISVQDGDGSLEHTIPKTAVEILGVTPDDTVEIDIYRNRYVVQLVEVATDGGDDG